MSSITPIGATGHVPTASAQPDKVKDLLAQVERTQQQLLRENTKTQQLLSEQADANARLLDLLGRVQDDREHQDLRDKARQEARRKVVEAFQGALAVAGCAITAYYITVNYKGFI